MIRNFEVPLFVLFLSLFLTPAIEGNPIELILAKKTASNRKDLHLNLKFNPKTSRSEFPMLFLFCRSGEIPMGLDERNSYKKSLKGLSRSDLKNHIVAVQNLPWKKGKPSDFFFPLKIPPLEGRTLYCVVAFLDLQKKEITHTVQEVFYLRRSPLKFTFLPKAFEGLSKEKQKKQNPGPLKIDQLLPVQILSHSQREALMEKQRREYFKNRFGKNLPPEKCGTPRAEAIFRERQTWALLLQVLETWDPRLKKLFTRQTQRSWAPREKMDHHKRWTRQERLAEDRKTLITVLTTIILAFLLISLWKKNNSKNLPPRYGA